MFPFAPGSRVLIRDEEWLVRRIETVTNGGWLLTGDGISELVRSQSALFLTELEDEIAFYDPQKAEFLSHQAASNANWIVGVSVAPMLIRCGGNGLAYCPSVGLKSGTTNSLPARLRSDIVCLR